MKKGDDMRAKIIATAEGLFLQKGYEDTSVQDILAYLNLSKVGFYHHFESKLALLEAICEQKSEEGAEKMARAVAECPGDAVDALNTLFDLSGLFRPESVDYLSLLLRVAYRGEGGALRERMKKATIRCCAPTMRDVILRGMSENVFFTRFPDEIGELLLSLFANLTDDLAELYARTTDAGDKWSDMLARTQVYRHAVETLLGAPYGRVLLYDMEQLYKTGAALEQMDREKTTV